MSGVHHHHHRLSASDEEVLQGWLNTIAATAAIATEESKSLLKLCYLCLEYPHLRLFSAVLFIIVTA